jgi:uncharacterized protein involved in cysteine biosynthesis
MISAARDRVASLVYGLTLPLVALRLILRNRALLLWSALPIALTLALSVWGVAWMKGKLAAAAMTWMNAHGYAEGSLTVQAALIFLQIILFVLAAVCFSILAGIVASPFNDLLAEATERKSSPPLPALPAEMGSFRAKVRAVWIDIVKTIAVGILQLGLIFVGLVAFWIPGLNLIPFALAFWLLAFQFVSYPQTRRGEDLRVSARFLREHLFATFGFGAAIGTLFSIPVVSAFALPLAVVGGTLLFARAQAGAPYRLR